MDNAYKRNNTTIGKVHGELAKKKKVLSAVLQGSYKYSKTQLKQEADMTPRNCATGEYSKENCAFTNYHHLAGYL